jgi:hypothetical protein
MNFFNNARLFFIFVPQTNLSIDMKKSLFIILALLMAGSAFAQKKEIIKKGWNFGPLPAVSFDGNLGFQYGVTCDIFNYGDGSNYPHYNYKFNVEASRYTKGSTILRFYADMPHVVKDTKLFFDITYNTNKAYGFYGYNGNLASPFDPVSFANTSVKDFVSGYNLLNRSLFRFIGSMQRPLPFMSNLNWTAGLAYFNIKADTLNLEKYAGQNTLYEQYVNAGIIHDDEVHGGGIAQLRLGLNYDSRDYTSDPTKGIYAEATLSGSTDKLGGNNGYNYLTGTFLWRHYVPVYQDRLTFAYRLGVQYKIAGDMPWYMLSNICTPFFHKRDTEGLGGVVTLRGVNLNSVIGEGFTVGNFELRWRIIDFQFINQNWTVALTPFFDAGMVIQTFREDEMQAAEALNDPAITGGALFYSGEKETLHSSAGCGLKLIMNRNLIISADFGKALNKRDGEGLKPFIGFNYIF